MSRHNTTLLYSFYPRFANAICAILSTKNIFENVARLQHFTICNSSRHVRQTLYCTPIEMWNSTPNFVLFCNNVVDHVCRVLGNSELGAKCGFWVKTRFGILVKGSCIWANQVWPRAILTPSKWPKFKNVLGKSHKGDLPTGWDVFWLKAI